MSETEDILLEEAIEAIENGQYETAREMLARLLKSDQRNANYWLWMSVVSPTHKEQVYCLKTALKIDPENEAARRGLVLLGEMKAEGVAPFPLDHVIAWMDDVTVKQEEEGPRGFKGFIARPTVRISAIGLGLLVLVGVVFSIVGRPRLQQFQATFAPTSSAPTATPTPTSTPAPTVSVPVLTSATPLSAVFAVEYTPTPLYVQQEHDAQTREVSRAAMTEFEHGNYDLALNYFDQLLEYEPQAVDAYYYKGEIYRAQGDYNEALNAYNQALDIDPNFGPAYLGRARVLPLLNPKAAVADDLQKAVQLSPDFLDAHLALAQYYLDEGEIDQAQAEAQAAAELAPDAPAVHLMLAKIYLAQEDYEQALTEAETANQQDVTLLEAYFILGKIYYLTDDVAAALEPLQIYVVYQPDNAEAWMMLAAAYNAQENYGEALQAANQAYELDRHMGEVYYQRARAYLGLGEGKQAEYNYKTALQFFPKSFDVSMGIAHALMVQEKFGDAYQQVEHSKPLAQSDAEWVQFYYWRAYTLEKIDRHDLAIESWQALLDYPSDLVPADWRDEAEAALQDE